MMRWYAMAGLLLGIFASLAVLFQQGWLPAAVPDFELATARHGKIRLSDLAGRKVVLVFFRSTR